jgi:2-methylcitrate dehydratase
MIHDRANRIFDGRTTMDATIQRIADYACALRYDDLGEETVHQTKRRIIDTIGCALGGYDAEPCRIARAIASRAAGDPGARIFGTQHRALPELAAFANGVMGRYLDGNDTFPGGGGHPSDTIAAAIAVAEARGAGGRDLIAAIALAYEVYHAFFTGALMRERGLDHVFYTAVGSAVGAGKLLGLDADRMGQAVALAVTPNLALHATRRGELSMWKGCAAGNGVRNGLFAALLAAEGMTGPENAIEGSDGLRELVGKFELGELAEPGGTHKVTQSNIKYFLSEYHSQTPITVAIELSKQVRPEEIDAITVYTYWFTWSEIGSEPEKWHPTTRESADHSLPFIIAAVMIDGAFSDAIFSDERIRDSAVHALADKVAVVEDPEFTARFPSALPCRLEVRTTNGEVKTASVEYPRGHIKNPMTDEEVEAKFRALAGRMLAVEQVERALACLWEIDSLSLAGAALDPVCDGRTEVGI